MVALWILILYVMPTVSDLFERRRAHVRLPESPAVSSASPAMAWAPSPGQYKPPSLWIVEARVPVLSGAHDVALPPPTRPYAASRHDSGASPSPPLSPYSPRSADPLMGARFGGHPYASGAASTLSTPASVARHPFVRAESSDGHGAPSSQGHSSSGHATAWAQAA